MIRRIVAIWLVLSVGIFFTGLIPEASGAVDYSIIRVRLSSMGKPTSLKVEVAGNYSIPENKNIHLQKKVYDIGIKNGNLTLKDGNTVYTLGTKFTFKQHKGADSDCLVIQNSSYGKLSYKGDMVVSLESGAICLTNHIYLETYLYGVVPSEMPNSWNLEALKAQAVAARTYAVRNKKTGSSSNYDLVDTQSSQVYKGYNTSWGNSIKAVNETAKQVLKYGGSFVHTFYSSSNGGWIEAGYEVFPGISKTYEPLLAKEDPYDPVHKWSISLYKNQINMQGRDLTNPGSWWASVSEKNNSGNYKSLITTLKDELKNKAKVADVKIVSIDDIKFSGKTVGQRYNNVTFTLSFYAKKDSQKYVMDNEGSIKLCTEDITITTVKLRSCIGASTVRSYYINEPVLQNEGKPAEACYVISGQGFGHGVGLSQYGAKAMADSGYKYTDILDFYYPKSALETLNISPPNLTEKPSGNDDQSGGSTQPPPDEEDYTPPVYGTVKVETNLNVRQGPGTQYKRIGSLGPNTRVQILGREGEWYRIKAGSIQGYVHSDYVELEKEGQEPSPPGGGEQEAPKPPVDSVPPPNDEKRYAVVTASALNVRSGPSTKNHIVGVVVKGTRLTVLEEAGSWFKIEYNGITGYVSGQYIKLESGETQPPGGGSSGGGSGSQVIAKGIVTATALNVRSGA
ncbi:MAG: SpoIID/LytB domain-containing protein, partial [Clostridiales bacterium]|nr:SpoIID/LytB domain-containing protein [Clostridiales bacterium]